METRQASGVRVPAPRHSWDPPAAPPPLRTTRHRRVRRAIGTVLVLGLIVVVPLVGINLRLVHQLDRIDGAFDGLTGRPAATPGRTLLMVGTRPDGPGTDVPWLAGQQSVESVMLIDIAPDGMSASVETLPQHSGISSVAASSPASAAVAAVESWSGRRVDHFIAIDWATFVRLAGDNGVDPAYAYGSGPGVEHDFLRRVMEGTLNAELRKQPRDLYRALSTTADGTAVDDALSFIELDWMLLSLRNLRSQEITYSMARPG